MNRHRLIKALLVAASGGVSYMVYSALFQAGPACACGNSGLITLKASYRAQQARVLEQGAPMTAMADLKEHLAVTDRGNYTYKLEKRSGLIYQWAIATRKDIPSYVSVLEILPINGEDATQTHTSRLLICETEKLGQVSIPVPLVDNTNDFQCDGGTQVVLRDRKVL